MLYGKDAHYPNQISEERDYEIIKLILSEELLQSLDFVTSSEVGKKSNHEKRKGTLISENQLKEMALSPDIEVPINSSNIMESIIEATEENLNKQGEQK